MRVRKYKKTRTPHKVILVICEGETEEAYINLLKREYRLPVTIKTKVVGNSINPRLVSQYMKEMKVSPEECSVFYVYDGDVEEIKTRVMNLEGGAIISTPCIELWFVLHVKECRKPVSSEAAVKVLSGADPLWHSYAKGGLGKDQGAYLISNKDIAIARARKLKWPGNPSSNMYDFIMTLESEKSQK